MLLASVEKYYHKRWEPCQRACHRYKWWNPGAGGDLLRQLARRGLGGHRGAAKPADTCLAPCTHASPSHPPFWARENTFPAVARIRIPSLEEQPPSHLLSSTSFSSLMLGKSCASPFSETHKQARLAVQPGGLRAKRITQQRRKKTNSENSPLRKQENTPKLRFYSFKYWSHPPA